MKYSFNEIREPWYPEEFKIIEFEDIKKNTYAISNYGRVMNINTNNILSQINDHGYRKVALYGNASKKFIYFIHVLVAHHFIPKTEDDINNNRNIINHKNFITSDNYVHNLEWVNYQENMAHFQEYGHLKMKNIVQRKTDGWNTVHRGEEIYTSKLTEEQVHTVCKLLEEGCNDYKLLTNAIGLEYNKNNRQMIYNISRGVRWKHISSQYNLSGPGKWFDYSPYAKPACEMLEQGLKPKQIISMLGLEYNNNTLNFIVRLKQRKVFTKISKDYNF